MRNVLSWAQTKATTIGFVCDVCGVGFMAAQLPEVAAPLLFIGGGFIFYGCHRAEQNNKS